MFNEELFSQEKNYIINSSIKKYNENFLGLINFREI